MRLLTGANSMHSQILDQETPRRVMGNHSLKNVLDIVPFSCYEIYMLTLLHGRSLRTGYTLNKLNAFYSNISYSLFIEFLLCRNDV
jgi:hypothetical protein